MGYKRLYLLTNKHWLQKDINSSNEFLYGVLLHADGIIKTNLNEINVVRTQKRDNNWYFINFFYFYEDNWPPYVPLLGTEVNLKEYQDLLNNLKEILQLEFQFEDPSSHKVCWYFKASYQKAHNTNQLDIK